MHMNEQMPPKEGQPKNVGNIIIGVLLVVVIILLFSFFSGDQQASLPVNGDVSDETAEDAVDEPVFNFEGIHPTDWGLTERAQNGVQSLQAGQLLQFYVVEDPTQDDVVYFATSHREDDADEVLLSVYEYRTDNFNFERLFRRSYEPGDIDGLPEEALPVMRVVGYDSGSLVLLVQANDDSPGPCAVPLLLADSESRMLWGMSIEEPYGGFEEYEPPAEILEAKEVAQEKCQSEL